MERTVWEYDSADQHDMWEDSQIEVVVTEDHVLVVVTDEHAVDSYNDTFRNAIKLPWPRVRELRDVLDAALASVDTLPKENNND